MSTPISDNAKGQVNGAIEKALGRICIDLDLLVYQGLATTGQIKDYLTESHDEEIQEAWEDWVESLEEDEES